VVGGFSGCCLFSVFQIVGVEELLWLTSLLRLPDDGFPRLLRVSVQSVLLELMASFCVGFCNLVFPGIFVGPSFPGAWVFAIRCFLVYFCCWPCR